MMRTVRFAVVFAAAAVIAGAAFGQVSLKGPYTVKDLVIEKTSPTSFQDALTEGRNEAKLTGADRLIKRLTLPEDVQVARQPLNPVDVAAFGVAVTTQMQDKRSTVAGGYRVSTMIAQGYNPERVRQYLEQRGVPYVDAQAGLALLVPAVAGGVNPNDWAATWQQPQIVNSQPTSTMEGKRDETVLTPFVASMQAWPRRPNFTEVSAELGASGANHAVVAEVSSQSGQYYVRLIDLRTNVPDTSASVAGPFSSLQAAQAGAVAEMERAWKTASIVRTSGSSNIALTASFQNIAEWAKIRKSLEGSRLISGLNVESVSQTGADISFVYTGRPDQLASDLRSRGVALSGTDGGWRLAINAPQ